MPPASIPRLDRHLSSPARDGGWSFVELIGATAIVGVAMLVMLQQMTISYRASGASELKDFAYQKALAIASELQSSVDRGETSDALTLETFDDLGVPNPVLTTLRVMGLEAPVAPDHIMSANSMRDGDWLWWRLISIEPMRSSERMRYVRITLKRRLPSGSLAVVASIGTVINLATDSYSPTQVHDVYVLAIDTVPSMSDPIDKMRSSFESTLASMRANTPGMDFRVHWITKTGYGRDSRYVPYVNTLVAASDSAPFAYWYPGELGGGRRLFTPELFEGRIRTENGVQNDYDATDNAFPHAVADAMNHCMRAPRANRLHASRVLAGDESTREPPLRLLLDSMWARPDEYRNAIFINLHGETLPCPPLRNYSDAAQSTAGPGVRVVTHPERLWTARDPDGSNTHEDTGDVVLRVYAYQTESAASEFVDVATLQIFGLNLIGNINGAVSGAMTTLKIENLPGGVNRQGTLDGDLSYASSFQEALASTDGPQPREMHYECGFVLSPVAYTWVTLRNTPSKAPLIGGRGLHADANLYGLEYIPSPVLADGSFAVDLSMVDTTARPKNTARWRITIPRELYDPSVPGGSIVNADSVVTVGTRIGADLTSGQMWPTANDPANYSETYSWWTSSPEAIPPTERFQFQGDPRHNPYADLAVGGASYAVGYNRSFDDLREPGYAVPPADWPCLDFGRLSDGGAGGNIVDTPRMFAMWRSCLQSIGGVWTHAEGLLAGAVAIGGEISGPRGDLGDVEPSVIPVAGDYFGTPDSVITYDAIAALPTVAAAPMVGVLPPPISAYHGRTVLLDSGSAFWAKPWLGEFAPDSYPAFETIGNLPTTRFRHELRETASLADLPNGTDFAFASGSRCGSYGSVEWLLSTPTTGGPLEQVFHPPSTTIAWNLEVAEHLSVVGAEPEMSMPLRWPIRTADPSFVAPSHWGEISFPGSSLTELEFAGTVGSFAGGSMTSLKSLADSTLAAYFSVLGATPISAEGRQRALSQSLALGLRTIYVAGSPTSSESVEAHPALKIVAPSGAARVKQPTDFVVQWQTPFVRFDGRAFTSDYPSGWVGRESLLGYVVFVSMDEGVTWTYAMDGASATVGTRVDPSSPYWLPDAGAGNESFRMSTPPGVFPSGKYLIRVECYHAIRGAHYSHHQQVLTIDR